MQNKVKAHLMDDMKMFQKEIKEDKKLMKKMSENKADSACPKSKMMEKAVKVKKTAKVAKPKVSKKLGMKGKIKLDKVMKEFSAGKLRSGSKQGPKVKNVKQALAIGYSEARRASKKK